MTGWRPVPTIPADVETVVTSALRGLLDPATVAVDEAGRERADAWVVVTLLPSIPGPATRHRAAVNITSIAQEREDALDLARAAHAAMLGLPMVTGGVQAVDVSTMPYPVPSAALDGPARYSASYLVLVAGTTA